MSAGWVWAAGVGVGAEGRGGIAANVVDGEGGGW